MSFFRFYPRLRSIQLCDSQREMVTSRSQKVIPLDFYQLKKKKESERYDLAMSGNFMAKTKTEWILCNLRCFVEMRNFHLSAIF